jgi:hypothetical protein
MTTMTEPKKAVPIEYKRGTEDYDNNLGMLRMLYRFEGDPLKVKIHPSGFFIQNEDGKTWIKCS